VSPPIEANPELRREVLYYEEIQRELNRIL
jgi:hypothetical protein